MRPLGLPAMDHPQKGYKVYGRLWASELFTHIERRDRRAAIAEIPAVSAAAGEGALRPLVEAAIERDLRTASA